jgi:hypothetical protein
MPASRLTLFRIVVRIERQSRPRLFYLCSIVNCESLTSAIDRAFNLIEGVAGEANS